ncbi:P-II family nitrogen regulator [Aliikangiella sp. IMCC44653]
MYWLTTIIRPFKLSDVYDKLIQDGINGMTITEVKGFGNHKAVPEIYRGNTFTSRFVPKVKIEMAVTKADLNRVIQSIVDVSHTGSPGDGKIFVWELAHSLRIRTREIDLKAI